MSTQLTIYYISSKKGIIALLQDHYAAQGIKFAEYPIKKAPEVKYLMILEPVKVKDKQGDHQYAISRLWKRWLFNQKWNTCLFVAGYFKSEHSNFLNLLELPSSLEDWLQELFPINAFALQYAGTEKRSSGEKIDVYSDPWDRFLPVRGIDIIKQLGRFLDGHDKHYSFYNQLSRIRKEIVDIETLASVGDGFDLEQWKEQKKRAEKEWEYLQSRWQYYEPLFSVMPFQKVISKITTFLGPKGILSQFFKDWQFENNQKKEIQKIAKSLNDLITLVQQSIEHHVYPERFW